VPSCSSVVSNHVTPEVEQSGSVSGACVRLFFSAGRQMAFYCLALLGPVSVCTLPVLVLLLPRPLSRDGDVTGGRFDWRILRVPALLIITVVFIFQLHFVSSLLRTQLSLIGNCCFYISCVCLSLCLRKFSHTVFRRPTNHACLVSLYNQSVTIVYYACSCVIVIHQSTG